MHTGSCHCGDVRVEIVVAPAWAIDCNCSICRRTGARWGILESSEVRVEGHPDLTEPYAWGSLSITTFRCRRCGCVTHWLPSPDNPDRRVGVNLRNFDPVFVASLRVRRFDGADRWDYLD